MALRKGLGLPGDRLEFRAGFDDNNEDKRALARGRRMDDAQTRVTLALNTYYPEVRGGYYLNRGLVALAQESLESLGMFTVALDCADSDTLIPVEAPGSLQDFDEEYVLVDEAGHPRGSIMLWAFHAGGGGEFYADKHIVDVVLPGELVEPFKAQLDDLCRKHGVEFSVRAPEAARPAAERKPWWRLW